MKTKLRTNTLEVQKLTSKLLKKGIRVFIEHKPNIKRGAQHVISYERLILPGLWGNKSSFGLVEKDKIEDAYVKTIEFLYRKEIEKNYL